MILSTLKMSPPEVTNHVWECSLPHSSVIRQNLQHFSTFSDNVTFDSGVLSRRWGEPPKLVMDISSKNFLKPTFILALPRMSWGKFNACNARLELLAAGNMQYEFSIYFQFQDPSRCRYANDHCFEGEPIGYNVRDDAYLMRLFFTVELHSKGSLTKESFPSTVSVPKKSRSSGSLPDPSLSDLFLRKVGDVKIVCGKEEFVAHKGLLSEKSPVFRQMFESEMTESLTGKLVLDEKDIAPNSVLQLLHFLYTGKMEECKEVCWDLFIAGEKYEMLGLKGHFEGYLARILSQAPEEAVELYAVGETHNGTFLKTRALETLKMHKARLFPDATAFRSFCKKYPQLAFQAFVK